MNTKQTEALRVERALKLALGYVTEALEHHDSCYNRHPATEAERNMIVEDLNFIREALAEQCVCGEPDTPGTHRTDGPCLAEQTASKPLSNLTEDNIPAFPWVAQPAQQQESVAWCPDVCPITGLPFFMWIEHYETGQRVPTYGGPYDSYTIPVRDKNGSYCRERYDHDLGGWRTDEVEDVGIQIVSDQAYVSDGEPPASKPLTDEQKDAARWRWLSWHIKAGWDEGKFTSLVRIVSDENRLALNASIDRMMAGDWSDTEAAHGITGEQK